jgi:hypothetical protein
MKAPFATSSAGLSSLAALAEVPGGQELVELVTVEPCVCIYSGVRTDKLVIKSKPVLDQHVQEVKRWRGSRDAAEALTSMLNDKALFEDVRRNAAYTLGLFPEEATTAVPSLMEAHYDDYLNVFEAAHWALKNIDIEAYARAPASWPARKQISWDEPNPTRLPRSPCVAGSSSVCGRWCCWWPFSPYGSA